MIITGIEEDPDLADLKARCLGSLLCFIETFFKIETGKDFFLGTPVSRECHYITVCRELTNVFYLRQKNLMINIPPGHGKSTLLSYFIAWCFAHHPDCKFLYVSYSHDLAAEHTSRIKKLMQLYEYRQLFGVEISRESSAKDNFKTSGGGAVKAFGSSGSITGQDAGLPCVERYSGGVIMDDMHKPDEVYSDSTRKSVIRNYNETIKPRPRDPKVGSIILGQMLAQEDLYDFIKQGKDGQLWKIVCLAAEDGAGNILAPHLTPRDMLEREKKFNPVYYYAQLQQNPLPPGGGIFKEDDFELLAPDPSCLATFLTVDTAETDKTYNDATVFSFWGYYEIESFGRKTGEYGLHWIDCAKFHVEPCDLEETFRAFYASCMLYKVRPSFVAIEKKSTGTTLSSILKKHRGIDVRDIERTKASGSKVTRYLEIQSLIKKRLVSLPKHGKHVEMCLEQCKNVTTNNTHRHDDIVDTLYDAVKMALIDENLKSMYVKRKGDTIAAEMAAHFKKTNDLRVRAWS